MKKRKDGYYERAVTINGKRTHVYGHSLKEISAKIDLLYDEEYNGITNDVTFRQYAEHWLEVALVDKAVNTIRSYTRAIQHMIDLIGDLRLQDIKRSEIEKALSEYADKPNMRQKMLARTVNIFDMAVDDEICKYNPASNIRLNKPDKTSRDRLTAKEIEAVKKADLRDDLRLMIDVMYYTGIRRGEVLGLTRKSIGNGVIHITEQRLWTESGTPFSAKLKTHNSVRDIPIHKELEMRLREYARTTDTIFLFDQFGTRSSYTTAWKRFKIAVVRVHNPDYKPKKWVKDLPVSEIPCRITAHYLRHNYCSILHDKGVDVLVAQKLMGHASLSTTLGIYTHLDEEQKVDRFNEVRDIMSAI